MSTGQTMNAGQRCYLDYAATAPLLPEVLEALAVHNALDYGNAQALYAEGKAARTLLEASRFELATLLGCTPPELSFCSGGTEGAGSLVWGLAQGAVAAAGRWKGRRHLICSAFEHHTVLDAAFALRRDGFEVDLLQPERNGRITPQQLERVLRPDTLLVSIMLAQNELGSVQPIAELAALAHQKGALFMTDAVQALGKIPLNLATLGVDAACFSAHKLGGPKGMGAFYLRRTAPFLARQLGGGQEQGRRSGTQDVPGAIAFACAARRYTPEYISAEGTRLAVLCDSLLAQLRNGSTRISATIPLVSGDTSTQLPGYLPLLIAGAESSSMVLRLDEAGFAVSGGAACASGSLEPSHVLTALGIARQQAHGALRVSLGLGTTAADCARFAQALLALV